MKNNRVLCSALYNENIAVILENGRRITYKEMIQASERIYSYIGKRCLVFCMCDNQLECLEAYVAFINNHVVPVMLDAAISDEMLNKMIHLYRPEFIWSSKQRDDSRNTSEEDSEHTIRTLYSYNKICEFGDFVLYKLHKGEGADCGGENGTGKSEGTNCKGENSTGKSESSSCEIDNRHCEQSCDCDLNENLALLLTTSGSTGSPKLVRISYDNLFDNAKSIIEYLEIDEKEITITTLPMNYSYGLSIINSHLLSGASIVLNKRNVFDKRFWKLVSQNRVTSFGGVPYSYELLDRINFYKMKLPDLRYITQAGGRLSANLHKKFAEYAINTNKKFIVMYGQTEATARMCYLPSQKAIDKIGSVGIPIPNGTIELIDNDEVITGPDIEGEIIYKGANVAMGYANERADLCKADEWKGILKTGDIGRYDKDGYIYITGRRSRFVKLYGIRTNLDELEKIITARLGENIQCMCTGTDDNINIYVTDIDCAEIIENILTKELKIHKNVIHVHYIEKIPRNSSGKPDYSFASKCY